MAGPLKKIPLFFFAASLICSDLDLNKATNWFESESNMGFSTVESGFFFDVGYGFGFFL